MVAKKKIRVPQVPIRVPYVVPTQESQSNSSAQNVNTQNIQPKAASPTKKRTVIKVSTPAPTPVNYGLIGGIQKGWSGQKGVIDDQSFKALQSLGYSGERNAQAAQQWINNNLSKYGITGSSVATDNAWGEQSNRALKMMIQNKANDDLASVFPSSNPSYSTNEMKPMIIQQTPSIDQGIANLKLNVPTYVNANRSQTRDWMRSIGINPYSVTGAMRKAVRRLRAGQANDNDKLLVQGNDKLYDVLKGYYKQGGQFPSRNIIERFKLRIKI